MDESNNSSGDSNGHTNVVAANELTIRIPLNPTDNGARNCEENDDIELENIPMVCWQ